jgi:nucleoside-diphosphate-sugar epimerase
MKRKKKVVVLGASGAIGSRFFQKLNEITSLQVTGISHKKNIKSNIFQCNYKNFNNKIKKTAKDSDVIINCIGEHRNQDLMDYKNKSILKKLLKIVNTTKKKKIFFHISSCAVYGSSKIRKIDENVQPKPQNLYSKSKFEGENFLKQNLNKKINLIIIRSPQVIGFGLNNSSLKNLNFIIKKKLFFYTQNQYAKFSYIFIDDLIRVIIKLFDKKNTHYNVFNVSNNIPFGKLVNLNKKYLNIKTKYFSVNLKIMRILFFFFTILFKPILIILKRKFIINENTLNSINSNKIYVSEKILKYLRIIKFTSINKKNFKLLIQ